MKLLRIMILPYFQPAASTLESASLGWDPVRSFQHTSSRKLWNIQRLFDTKLQMVQFCDSVYTDQFVNKNENKFSMFKTHNVTCGNNCLAGAPTGFSLGGHRRRKGSVVGGTMASAEHEPITGVQGQSTGGQGGKAPWSWKHFGHWMSNGAGKLAPFQKCICISTLDATVIIWEKFMSKSRGVRWPPLPLPGGAHAASWFGFIKLLHKQNYSWQRRAYNNTPHKCTLGMIRLSYQQKQTVNTQSVNTAYII